MSRRRGEFEHRTSLFEGAYRAWSHLGSLDPTDVFAKTPSEIDPLTYIPAALIGSASAPLKKSEATDADAANASGDDERETPAGSAASASAAVDSTVSTNPDKRVWRYEPLPRSGLEHPYVRAILNPWLGADAEDPDEVEQGLATLRNWWQHRRKGESRSAVNALGTDKMKGIVDGYTRHFFSVALDMVKRDKAHPPKTLLTKMGGPKSERNRKNKPKRKKGHSEDEEEVGEIMTAMAAARSMETARSAAASIAGLAGLSSLEGMSSGAGAVAGPTGGIKDPNLALLSGFGTNNLPLDHSAATVELLMEQQRQQAAMYPLDLASLTRQRQLLAASAVLTPMERFHLAERERRLALLGSMYSNPVAGALLPPSASAATNYSPPSWLLEPVAKQQQPATTKAADEKSP